jgi:hypothetical protein
MTSAERAYENIAPDINRERNPAPATEPPPGTIHTKYQPKIPQPLQPRFVGKWLTVYEDNASLFYLHY